MLDPEEGGGGGEEEGEEVFERGNAFSVLHAGAMGAGLRRLELCSTMDLAVCLYGKRKGGARDQHGQDGQRQWGSSAVAVHRSLTWQRLLHVDTSPDEMDSMGGSTAVCWAPNGRCIAVGTVQGGVWLLGTEDGERIQIDGLEAGCDAEAAEAEAEAEDDEGQDEAAGAADGAERPGGEGGGGDHGLTVEVEVKEEMESWEEKTERGVMADGTRSADPSGSEVVALHWTELPLLAEWSHEWASRDAGRHSVTVPGLPDVSGRLIASVHHTALVSVQRSGRVTVRLLGLHQVMQTRLPLEQAGMTVVTQAEVLCSRDLSTICIQTKGIRQQQEGKDDRHGAPACACLWQLRMDLAHHTLTTDPASVRCPGRLEQLSRLEHVVRELMRTQEEVAWLQGVHRKAVRAWTDGLRVFRAKFGLLRTSLKNYGVAVERPTDVLYNAIAFGVGMHPATSQYFSQNWNEQGLTRMRASFMDACRTVQSFAAQEGEPVAQQCAVRLDAMAAVSHAQPRARLAGVPDWMWRQAAKRAEDLARALHATQTEVELARHRLLLFLELVTTSMRRIQSESETDTSTSETDAHTSSPATNELLMEMFAPTQPRLKTGEEAVATCVELHLGSSASAIPLKWARARGGIEVPSVGAALNGLVRDLARIRRTLKRTSSRCLTADRGGTTPAQNDMQGAADEQDTVDAVVCSALGLLSGWSPCVPLDDHGAEKQAVQGGEASGGDDKEGASEQSWLAFTRVLSGQQSLVQLFLQPATATDPATTTTRALPHMLGCVLRLPEDMMVHQLRFFHGSAHSGTWKGEDGCSLCFLADRPAPPSGRDGGQEDGSAPPPTTTPAGCTVLGKASFDECRFTPVPVGSFGELAAGAPCPTLTGDDSAIAMAQDATQLRTRVVDQWEEGDLAGFMPVFAVAGARGVCCLTQHGGPLKVFDMMEDEDDDEDEEDAGELDDTYEPDDEGDQDEEQMVLMDEEQFGGSNK